MKYIITVEYNENGHLKEEEVEIDKDFWESIEKKDEGEIDEELRYYIRNHFPKLKNKVFTIYC